MDTLIIRNIRGWNFMTKYIETAKILFKTQLVYRFDIIIHMVFTITKIILAYVLWGTIFSDHDSVAGFSFHAMISYYIISSFIEQLDQSSKTGEQIAAEIRNGHFSKYMVRPMRVFGYFTFQTAGVSLFLLSFNFIATVLWVLLLRIEFSITHHLSMILWSTTMCVLGLLFMMQLNYFIGILAFKFLDVWMFMMIKDNVVQFIRGSLIPLILIPSQVLTIMKYFPFYYVTYLPSMLLLGRNEGERTIGITTLVLWNIVFGLLNTITYKRLIRRYEGVGI